MDGVLGGTFALSLAPPIKRWIKERETVLVAAADDAGLAVGLAARTEGVTGFAAGASADWRWMWFSNRWRKAANASPSWRALLCCHVFGSVM
jgi:hypothetical protein